VRAESLLTATDVERLSLPDKQVELVRGHLVVREPPGTRHGAIAANLTCLVGAFVRRHGLGVVFAQDTGFKITSDPDTVRAPDVAFVARERTDRIPARGYAPWPRISWPRFCRPTMRRRRSSPRSPTGSRPVRSWCG